VELRGLCSSRERLRVKVNVISLSVKGRVRTPAVKKYKVPLDDSLGRCDGVVRMQIDLFVLSDFHSGSTKTLSRHAASRPSMLMRILFLYRTSTKVAAVN
jgi:hypothetical protein